jgi:hypothetical protein
MTPFADHFPNAINIFNDELPNRTYFDLESVLDKYDYLDKSKCGELFAKWKRALENVQQDLGRYESQIIGHASFSEKYERLFLKPKQATTQQQSISPHGRCYDKSGHWQQPKQNQYLVAYFCYRQTGDATFTFNLLCKESNWKLLQSFAQLLYKTHEIEKQLF